jgi:transcriptional regulator with XRE-family HTH domain
VPEYWGVRDDISKRFGQVVRRQREARDLSQEKLAALSGIHRTYVSSIELGKVRLGLDIAKKVADGLGVPLSVLVAEAERDSRHRARPARRQPE